MKIIKTITDQINWYYDNSNRSIHQLIELQRGLACNSFYLASELANLKRDYNIAYFMRKIHVSKQQQGFLQNKMTLGKAKIEADIECEKDIEMEVNAESEAFRCEVLLKQINRILSSIQQEISNLKVERQESKKLT